MFDVRKEEWDINLFSKKPIVEFTKNTKKNKGHNWELLGITEDL